MTFVLISASVTTMKCRGCAFAPYGLWRAASRIIS